MRKPKKSAVDFIAENLPKTRRERFVDCLKIRYIGIAGSDTRLDVLRDKRFR